MTSRVKLWSVLLICSMFLGNQTLLQNSARSRKDRPSINKIDTNYGSLGPDTKKFLDSLKATKAALDSMRAVNKKDLVALRLQQKTMLQYKETIDTILKKQ